MWKLILLWLKGKLGINIRVVKIVESDLINQYRENLDAKSSRFVEEQIEVVKYKFENIELNNKIIVRYDDCNYFKYKLLEEVKKHFKKLGFSPYLSYSSSMQRAKLEIYLPDKK